MLLFKMSIIDLVTKVSYERNLQMQAIRFELFGEILLYTLFFILNYQFVSLKRTFFHYKRYKGLTIQNI